MKLKFKYSCVYHGDRKPGEIIDLPKQLGSQSVFLPQQRQQQMDLLQLLMTVLDRKILCRLHSFQRLLGIVVEIHSNPSFRFSTLVLRVLIYLSL